MVIFFLLAAHDSQLLPTCPTLATFIFSAVLPTVPLAHLWEYALFALQGLFSPIIPVSVLPIKQIMEEYVSAAIFLFALPVIQ